MFITVVFHLLGMNCTFVEFFKRGVIYRMFQAERKIFRPIKLAIEKFLRGSKEAPLLGVFVGVIQEKCPVIGGKWLA